MRKCTHGDDLLPPPPHAAASAASGGHPWPPLVGGSSSSHGCCGGAPRWAFLDPPPDRPSLISSRSNLMAASLDSSFMTRSNLMEARRDSNFITDLSVAGRLASMRHLTKPARCTPGIAGSSKATVFSTSSTSRLGTCDTEAALWAKATSDMARSTSSISTQPSPSMSSAENKSSKACRWALFSSSSCLIFMSSACCAVAEIMFSLTTAVKMERNVQELVIMKKTKANLIDGRAVISSSIACASGSDSAPLMTRKSVNMLSATERNGFKTSSGISAPGGKIILWPTSRAATMPIA
mmetsp:Transcript_79892/g.207694  ORF Transcript_79892/g.207694 Transcript_79892/m.207694 type:complete len:295 (-) Transcript_79892:924-1808(-)